MKKKHLFIPVLSTALLAPVLLAGHVAADEVAPSTTTAVAEASTTAAAPAAEASAATSTAATTESTSASSEAAAPAATTTVAPAAESTTDAVILHTNDVHGRILEESNVIGDAKLATVIKEERAKNKTTLVLDAGDAFQGLPISNSSKGEERAKLLNAMGYDAMAVGNHEFDFGLDEVKKYKELLNFPILSANTYINGVRLFEPYTIIDKDETVKGDEFIVIGLTTPETKEKTHPKNVTGVTFEDPLVEIDRVMKELASNTKAKDVQNYVFLSHLGVDTTTPTNWRGDTVANALAKLPALQGKRIIFIDGHSHTERTDTVDPNVTYNQTGSYLHNIGKITLKSGELLGKAELLPASEMKKAEADPTILAMVNKIKADYEADNAKVVRANNPVEFNGDRENVRVRETNLGNLVADALYHYGQDLNQPSDLAVTNGGGLRETLKAGKDITKGDVIAVLPFGNTITQIKVTGQDIKDMFAKSLGSIHQVDKDGKTILDENGLPLLEPSGGLLHAAGVKVYYNTEKEGADRILGIKILDKASGKYVDLDLKKEYYLLTNDFIAAGGDGYTMFGKQEKSEGPSMDEAFETYLRTADLTIADYATTNPNLRLVATRELPKEDTSADDKKDDSKKDVVVPGGVYVPSTPADFKGQAKATAHRHGQTAPSTYGEPGATYAAPAASQTLPETGESSSAAVSVFGGLLAMVGLAGLAKRKENN